MPGMLKYWNMLVDPSIVAHKPFTGDRMPTTAYASEALTQLKVSCASCGLSDLCLPRGVDKVTLEQLDDAVDRIDPLPRSTSIFRQGEPLFALYAVRAGSVRSTHVGADGNEQVLGFHYPGDLLGLDALDGNVHQVTIDTLERTHLCALPINTLDNVLESVPPLRRQLLRIMSRNHAQDHHHLELMGRKAATSRVAGWLLSVSKRLHAHGYESDQLSLSMSRSDLGNYLGLAIETVSRTLSRLQADGIIEVSGRSVTLLDKQRLTEAADGDCS